MKEISAKGIRGFLLYSSSHQGYFFRVYSETNKRDFKDYKITAEDIEIQLLSNFNSLIEYDDGFKALDYSSEVLGKK
jgi:hypothetical protein